MNHLPFPPIRRRESPSPHSTGALFRTLSSLRKGGRTGHERLFGTQEQIQNEGCVLKLSRCNPIGSEGTNALLKCVTHLLYEIFVRKRNSHFER